MIKKGLSKREQEELRRKQDEAEAAQVFEEFVASFQDTGKHSKTWVKGGTVSVTAKGRIEEKTEKGKLYKPTSKLAELAATFQSVKELKKSDEPSEKPVRDYHNNRKHEREHEPQEDYRSRDQNKKKRDDSKKKSNLELFKEELKQIQEEREQRHKMKKIFRDQPVSDVESEDDKFPAFDPLDLDMGRDPFGKLGTLDLSTDENTTNIYVGNINPKMTEQQLCEIFGKYGPLASVKIMWPRTEEERSRGRNCGFVAFMNRKDGERAMNALKGKEICGFEMKLGWGKAVPIPPHPIYIPPALMELTLPPPPSGLPFNAQSHRKKERSEKFGRVPPPGSKEEAEELQKTLAKAVVKVVIPTERNHLNVIHRMIEFVVREGPMFEAMIMNRELNNPMYRFLFDNQSPAHIYYRWKLYSILNGDTPYKWRTEEFRMFRNGSKWKPPPMNPYTSGMPDELVRDDVPVPIPEEPDQLKKGQLTDSQRDRLEDMLRDLTPERVKIGDAMVWCLDHADSAEEIVECIAESLSILQTPIPKKVARLFLVSDILFNCSAKVPNASFFRKYFNSKLPEVFKDIHEAYESIDGRLKAEQFKQKVMGCFRAWEDWTVYPNDYLINLQNIFLGLVPSMILLRQDSEKDEEDLDGAPLDTEIIGDPDLDGKPLEDIDLAQIPDEIEEVKIPLTDKEEDLDGVPLEDTKQLSSSPKPKFAMSKWETVDETELEAQAMTTSKWDLLDQQEEEEEDEKDKNAVEVEEDLDGAPLEEDLDGTELVSDDGSQDSQESSSISTTSASAPERLLKQELSEERRAKLREIEVKVVKYQDEVESGKRSRKPGMTVAEQVEHHRKKLLSKEFIDSPAGESYKRHLSSSPYRGYIDSPKRSKRSKSPKRSKRSRSRSAQRKSASSSPSRHRKKSKKSKHRD
ncbi:hypothetical protein ACJMK2_018351 [Sinanodonta woodiana]|uniref:U2 snRNP-associated SURP motif-containing protein n=1 Tax=Sinanodonta woodiana TaxID=1069815 RepID=A0ABD3UDG2_SINWO